LKSGVAEEFTKNPLHMQVSLTREGVEPLAPANAVGGNGTRTSKIVCRRIAKRLGSYTELRE
jgi:hypothetical protein